jgi:hypothetical protein
LRVVGRREQRGNHDGRKARRDWDLKKRRKAGSLSFCVGWERKENVLGYKGESFSVTKSTMMAFSDEGKGGVGVPDRIRPCAIGDLQPSLATGFKAAVRTVR